MGDSQGLASLFNKLMSDDAFRSELASNPVMARSVLGVPMPAGMVELTLPLKEQVAEAMPAWLAVAGAASTAAAVFYFLK